MQQAYPRFLSSEKKYAMTSFIYEIAQVTLQAQSKFNVL